MVRIGKSQRISFLWIIASAVGVYSASAQTMSSSGKEQGMAMS
jgi:hypothetical protein